MRASEDYQSCYKPFAWATPKYMDDAWAVPTCSTPFQMLRSLNLQFHFAESDHFPRAVSLLRPEYRSSRRNNRESIDPYLVCSWIFLPAHRFNQCLHCSTDDVFLVFITGHQHIYNLFTLCICLMLIHLEKVVCWHIQSIDKGIQRFSRRVHFSFFRFFQSFARISLFSHSIRVENTLYAVWLPKYRNRCAQSRHYALYSPRFNPIIPDFQLQPPCSSNNM